MGRAQSSLGFLGAPPEPLPNIPEPKKPWLGICSPGCWRAKGDPSTCECRCGGVHHGMGRRKQREEVERE